MTSLSLHAISAEVLFPGMVWRATTGRGIREGAPGNASGYLVLLTVVVYGVQVLVLGCFFICQALFRDYISARGCTQCTRCPSMPIDTGFLGPWVC